MIVDGHQVPLLGAAALGIGVGYVAGMFGIGGGFLLTPLLVVLFHVPLPTAIGTGLCQMIATSLVAFLRHRMVRQGEIRFDILLLPGSMAAVLEHGFSRPERAMSATSTDGNRIAMIDWRPAFAVYQEIIKAEYGIDLTRENFYQHAVHFPFGILRANGDVIVRIPVALAEDDSLFCVGEIPENAVLVLLKAPQAGGNGCIGRLAGKLHEENGSLQGMPLLTFYCAGRRMHLGEAAESELAALLAGTGVGKMAGALSLGEIGSTTRWGYPMFHNATLVCTPWPKK